MKNAHEHELDIVSTMLITYMCVHLASVVFFFKLTNLLVFAVFLSVFLVTEMAVSQSLR